jgi:hypothetical protein
VDRAALIGELSSFDSVEALHLLLDGMLEHGWLVEEDGILQLTPIGANVHDAATAAVGEIRSQVATALPGDDYWNLVSLLERLVDAFPSTSG